MTDRPTHPKGDAARQDALGRESIRVQVPDEIDSSGDVRAATDGMSGADAGSIEGPVSDRIAPVDDDAATGSGGAGATRGSGGTPE